MNPKELPVQPGVYLFKDKEGKILYIGKAKNLRARVSSYFAKSFHSPKTCMLIAQIAHIEHIVVDNELEALLLENRLIKKHVPKYNISLKDSKTYGYICLTDDPFPRILSARKVTRKGSYFGPYTDGSAREELLALSCRLFKLRTCKNLPKKACLNYYIGLCTAPCIGNVNQEEYAKQVRSAHEFLKGNTKSVVISLESEMKKASEEMRYEVALERKRQIEAIAQLQKRQKVDLYKRFDQDVLALHSDGKISVIALFSISKGVLLGKTEFRFEHQDELFRSFVTQFYSIHQIPKEIIVNTRFWDDEGDRKTYERYFSSIKGAAVTITLPQRGEKLALMKLAEKNAFLKVS